VYFTNRRNGHERPKAHGNEYLESKPVLSDEGYVRARQAAPGYDIQGLYQEWVSWWRDSGSPELTSPDAAFVSFCRKRHERAPLR
jgi:hypothetical protein